jgi:hypothetical protein
MLKEAKLPTPEKRVEKVVRVEKGLCRFLLPLADLSSRMVYTRAGEGAMGG